MTDRIAAMILATTLCATGPVRGVDEAPPSSEEVGLYRACGLNCLTLIGHLKGIDARLHDVEALLKPRANGDSSVAEIESAARSLGLDPVSVRVDLAHLDAVPLPAIVQFRSRSPSSSASHYVVVLAHAGGRVVILDAPQPPLSQSEGQFEEGWTGVAVAFPSGPVERAAFLAALDDGTIVDRWGPVGLATASIVTIAVAGLLSRRRRVAASSLGASRATGPGSLARLVVGSLTVSSIGCVDRPSVPRLAISGPMMDLGVRENGEANFTIPVENRGGSPLSITAAKSSCSCTQVSIPEAPIAAGRVGAVTGTVSVRPGPGSAEVVLASDDPDRPGVTIRLSWFGKHVPTLSPSLVELPLRRGEAAEREVELSYPGGTADPGLEFVSVEGLPPGASLTMMGDDPVAIQGNPVLSRISVAGRARFRLRVVAPATVGASSAVAVVKVRHRTIDYALPLTLNLSTDDGIRAVPGRLLFTGSSMDKIRSVERRVVVKPETPGSLAVESKPEFLEVDLAEDGSALTRVTRGLRPGVSRGDLILRDTQGRRVVIPIFASYSP